MIMTSPKVRPKSWILLGACGLIVGLLWNSAHAQAPFYQGKTVTVVVGTSPAGTGDLRVKALIPFLRKHIPGNPALVLEYMDGGGGRKAANYMFRTARPDGLTIGAMSSGVISLNIMRESGVLDVWRVFRSVGSPYVLPPGTPKERVTVLQEAMRKTLNDAEMQREFLKLVGEEVEPMMPEELTKLIRETPRDSEIIELIKALSGAGPLPPRS